jgi:hypothetical protein
MTAARRQSPQPPVHRLTVPAGPVDGTGARGKMQGKIKGGGTQQLENPVCTRVWRGTRHGVAACREGAQCRIGIGKAACFALSTALRLDGAFL